MEILLLRYLMSYNGMLMMAAIVPAIILMIKVYKSDRLEKESLGLIIRLIISGIASALVAGLLERLGVSILSVFEVKGTEVYNVILYFIIVAGSEEGAKYFFTKRNTWNNREFNCQFDGVVYAVFVSLGFALWENISYVATYGMTTAVLRAFTAIPGHACFGVFMGVFYGLAKRHDRINNHASSANFRILAVLMPMLLHGSYDYIASSKTISTYVFLAFILVMFIISYRLVGKYSREDRYI